jgi:hypothetical protein
MTNQAQTSHVRPIRIALASLGIAAVWACSSSPDPQPPAAAGPQDLVPVPPGTFQPRDASFRDTALPSEEASVVDAAADADGGSNVCCGGVLCGSACRDLNGDHANCGSCGNACSADQVCTGGTCVVCGTVCSGVCADLMHDYDNCGKCGNACLNGDVCSSGSCVTCPTKVCAGSCVDLTADNVNCGSCGNKCLASQSCTGGKCVTCTSLCGGNCTDLQNDPANCGACGSACAPGDSCKAGSCVCL